MDQGNTSEEEMPVNERRSSSFYVFSPRLRQSKQTETKYAEMPSVTVGPTSHTVAMHRCPIQLDSLAHSAGIISPICRSLSPRSSQLASRATRVCDLVRDEFHDNSDFKIILCLRKCALTQTEKFLRASSHVDLRP